MHRLLWLALLASACTEKEDLGIGAEEERGSCNQISDCRAGLTCTNGACVPVDGFPDSFRGRDCAADPDCGGELVCGTQGVCTDFAGHALGETCGLLEDCRPPLICHGETGLCAAADGSAGTLDVGDACIDVTDCQRPYICVSAFDEIVAGGACQRLPPLFLGADCSHSDEERGAFRVHFELEPVQFYRQPFPSDIRRSAGGVDMAAHPSPGPVFGFDVVASFFDVVGNDVDGFALNAPIFFQLTDPPTNGSLCLDAGGLYPELPPDDGDPETPEPEPFCADAGAATVYLVNLDDPTERVPVELGVSKERGQFICQNWLGIVPRAGRPLRPNTRYAAVLTTGLRDIRGDAPIQDRDFAAIIGGAVSVPAMQPLLDWIASGGARAEEIAAAAVFTTGNPARIGQQLRDAIHAAAAPQFNGDHATCPTEASPDCTGGFPERQCGGAVVGYTEVHGTYSGPVFQSGTRPYLVPENGGAIEMSQQGEPQIVRTETMCYALAVPLGAAPAGGWPTVIYAHGTGGNYRSFLDDDVHVRRFIDAGYAVLGFDNVMHGPRMDPSHGLPGLPALWNVKDPGELFFNFVNPRASRDNVLQGAADIFNLVRLLREGANRPIPIDPARVVLFGHSQGTVIAPAVLQFENDLAAVVLSGAGAELPLSILNKTEPEDVSVAAGLFFGDRNLGRIHPMMGIMALVFGPADAVSFGRQAKPLLMFSGIGDLKTPDVTQHALMRSLELPLVGTVAEPVEGVGTAASGVSVGAVQYAPPAGENGHFVVYDVPEAGVTLQTFLDSARTGAARIVNP